MLPDQRMIWRSMEISSDIIAKQLGKEIEQILTALRPALLMYDITQERSSFFLDYQENLTSVRVFIKKGYDGGDPEGSLPPHIRWYLRELREDLKMIFQSGSLQCGWASHFVMHNRPPDSQPINPHKWHPKTIVFIESIRPELEHIIKKRYVDHWLQTPLDILGGLSPIQVIQYGEGCHIRALIEEIKRE